MQAVQFDLPHLIQLQRMQFNVMTLASAYAKYASRTCGSDNKFFASSFKIISPV